MSELEIAELIMGEDMLFLEKFTPLANFSLPPVVTAYRDRSHLWETSTEQPVLVKK